MASVSSQLIVEVTAHAQSDSLEDSREVWADGTYFPNNLRIYIQPPGRTQIPLTVFRLHNNKLLFLFIDQTNFSNERIMFA